MKRLHTTTIIFMGIITVILILLIYLLYVSINITKSHPGTCDSMKNTLLWNDDCTFIQEKLYDNNIETPTESLHLSRFSKSSSFGPPLGANVWYRYKYVNGRTGGYGKFSPWTKSPIIAGGENLPCKNDNCDEMKDSGKQSCRNNIVEVSVDDLGADIKNDMYANVYRYVAPANKSEQPSDNTEKDELIGYLIPSGVKGGKFIDVSTSPCETIGISCHVHC